MNLPKTIALLLSAGALLHAPHVHAQVDLLAELRGNIRPMFTDEAVCDRLYTRITTEKLGNEPLQQGYLGVLTMAKGTHKINPFSRLGTFNDGRDILDAAIVTAPNSVELRFLRFAIQVNVPSILGYGEERKTDKSFIEARLHEVHDETMRKRMIEFIARAVAQGKV